MSPKRKQLNVAALGAAAIPQPDPVHEANRSTAPTARSLKVVHETDEAEAVAPPTSKRAPSRRGLVQIQGYYPPETRRRLKILSVKMDRTAEDLLGEALAHLFEKYDG
jgi:antitoxin-like ribbon-helix-helix protein